MKCYARCLAAMGIAGGMALSAAAARTVSENLTLTRDTDWSADVVTVANSVTIDLNGHVLKVAGLDGATAASGTVTSSNGGELRFVIPAGTTNTLSKTRLAGNLRVFKEGPGGLVFNLKSQTYSGGTEVVEGALIQAMTGSNNPCGASYSEIRVDAGGVFEGLPRRAPLLREIPGGENHCPPKGHVTSRCGASFRGRAPRKGRRACRRRVRVCAKCTPWRLRGDRRSS